MPIDVNYVAVILAAVASMILGFLWYSPTLFGRQWMHLMGLTREHMEEAKKRGMSRIYVWGFIFELVTAYVLAHFISLSDVASVGALKTLVFWVWLGFMLPILAGSVLWENKPFKLLVINALYRLAALVVMGLILLYV